MVQAISPLSTGTKVNRLHDWLERFNRRVGGQHPVRSSGCEALDRLLPDAGFRGGTLVEWLGDGPASGVSMFPLMAARELQQTRSHERPGDPATLVVVDRQHRFYPPAAAAWGIDLAQTIIVRPATDQDELWAIDQAIRCPHIAAVLAWPDRIDTYALRRLQLAAEESGVLGLLVRPMSAAREPTWADLRLAVSSRPSTKDWRWNVRLLRARGRFGEGEVILELDEERNEIVAAEHAEQQNVFAQVG